MLIWQKKDKFEENKKQNLSKLILGFNSKKIFIAKFIALISIVGIFFVPLDLGINKSTKLSRFSSTISNSLYLALGGFNKSFGHLAKETFQYGDSLFFITYRYFRSAFFSSDELRLNLNIKNLHIQILLIHVHV